MERARQRLRLIGLDCPGQNGELLPALVANLEMVATCFEPLRNAGFLTCLDQLREHREKLRAVIWAKMGDALPALVPSGGAYAEAIAAFVLANRAKLVFDDTLKQYRL